MNNDKQDTIVDLIRQFIKGKQYFNTKALKDYLQSILKNFNNQTVNQYLSNLKKNREIYSCGRNWYSTIDKPFILDTEPVLDLIHLLNEHFPFLQFTVWNTRQIISYYHHLPFKYTYFIYTEFDALIPVFEFLVGKGFNVYNNPGKQIVRKHWIINDENYIIRPDISESPVEGTEIWKIATIEKILVDLYEEKDKLYLMDGSEFKRIFYNVIFSGRVNIPTMLKYSYRRSRGRIRKEFEKLLYSFKGEQGVVYNRFRRIND
ncbi:hypothetical protein KJ762_12565 [bacterium]|nr:hypothetical protein [bacterium]MBU1064433.1 hypothetical protein [bacterium]MBU1635325.1 hypothetical protein [bacterium]MBU1872103.1 hypothetical protein [bacterium]